MLPVETWQRFSTVAVLTAAQTSVVVMPGVTGYQYVIINGTLTCLVSAAQGVYLGDSSGTVKPMQAAASFAANAQLALQLLEGIKLTKSETVILKPDAAGPSIHAVVEGYILKDSAVLGTTT